MGLFGGKKYSLDGMPSFEKSVLMDCLDMVCKTPLGDPYKDLYATIKEGKPLKKDHMKEMKAFAGWYKGVVLGQPNLKAAFGEANYEATVNALGSIEDFAAKQL